MHLKQDQIQRIRLVSWQLKCGCFAERQGEYLRGHRWKRNSTHEVLYTGRGNPHIVGAKLSGALEPGCKFFLAKCTFQLEVHDTNRRILRSWSLGVNWHCWTAEPSGVPRVFDKLTMNEHFMNIWLRSNALIMTLFTVSKIFQEGSATLDYPAQAFPQDPLSDIVPFNSYLRVVQS